MAIAVPVIGFYTGGPLTADDFMIGGDVVRLEAWQTITGTKVWESFTFHLKSDDGATTTFLSAATQIRTIVFPDASGTVRLMTDEVHWSLITGRPTTSAGYGITEISVGSGMLKLTSGGNTASIECVPSSSSISIALPSQTASLAALNLPQSWTAGARQTFSHSSSSAGLRIAPQTGSPSSMLDGDVWYDSTDGRLKARENGVVRTLTQTTAIPPSIMRQVIFYTDFLAENANVSGLFTSNSSGGVVNAQGSVGHPGIVDVTSVNPMSWAFIGSGTSAILFGSGVTWKYSAIVRIPTLSDATNTFEVMVGFIDPSGGGDVVDGAYVYYRHDTNGGRWEYRTRSDSVQTAVDSGVSVTAGSWYLVEISVSSTSSTFSINKAATQTISTNIPSGSGRQTGFGVYKRQSAGLSWRGIHVDAILVEADYAADRA